MEEKTRKKKKKCINFPPCIHLSSSLMFRKDSHKKGNKFTLNPKQKCFLESNDMETVLLQTSKLLVFLQENCNKIVCMQFAAYKYWSQPKTKNQMGQKERSNPRNKLSNILLLFIFQSRVLGCHPLPYVGVTGDEQELRKAEKHNHGFEKERILLRRAHDQIHNMKNERAQNKKHNHEGFQIRRRQIISFFFSSTRHMVKKDEESRQRNIWQNQFISTHQREHREQRVMHHPLEKERLVDGQKACWQQRQKNRLLMDCFCQKYYCQQSSKHRQIYIYSIQPKPLKQHNCLKGQTNGAGGSEN